MNDGESQFATNPPESPKATKDVKKEYYLSKWAKGDHSTEKIISDVEKGVRSRH